MICNIGSAGMYNTMPFYSAYRASKMALAVVSEALRLELAPFGIRVIEVPIGGTDTDMWKSSVAYRPADAVDYEAYRPMALRQAEVLSQIAPSAVPAEESARRVADLILDDVASPLRRPADPGGEAVVDNVARTSEEQRMVATFDLLGVRHVGER